MISVKGCNSLKLEMFEGQNKSELSMIEVAHAILSQNAEPMSFNDLAKQVQDYLEKTDGEMKQYLSQFYTDLNTDGSFISLGNNNWGLRTWYPFDSIDEATVGEEEEEERSKSSHSKKLNAFTAESDDDDVIDYDSDDPEDNDFDSDSGQEDDNTYDSENDDLNNDLPDGIEGQLSEINNDDKYDDED